MAKILCIEDDKINALIFRKVLGQYFDIEIAKSAKECLEKLENNLYEAFLIDIHLADNSLEMDGIQLMKHLRGIEQYKQKPMIAVTAYTLRGDKEKYLGLGFDAYYSKPVKHKELVMKIQFFLEKK